MQVRITWRKVRKDNDIQRIMYMKHLRADNSSPYKVKTHYTDNGNENNFFIVYDSILLKEPEIKIIVHLLRFILAIRADHYAHHQHMEHQCPASLDHNLNVKTLNFM